MSEKTKATITSGAGSPVAIRVKGVTVQYKVRSDKPVSRGRTRHHFLPNSLKNKVNTALGKKHTTFKTALKNINLEIFEGQSVGILGLNGSGKSTLLRTIAGLETPTFGEVSATSQPTLLGISAALEPALSGAENVRLGCLAMGMHPSEIPEAIEEIQQFIEIGDAFYRPMEIYSAGMAARLRFAIATATHPKILLIDEALSAGDTTFHMRTQRKINEMREQAGVFMLVSHAPKTIEDMCDRAVWIRDGEVFADGPSEIIGEAYRHWAQAVAFGDTKEQRSRIRSIRNYQPHNIIPGRLPN